MTMKTISLFLCANAGGPEVNLQTKVYRHTFFKVWSCSGAACAHIFHLMGQVTLLQDMWQKSLLVVYQHSEYAEWCHVQNVAVVLRLTVCIRGSGARNNCGLTWWHCTAPNCLHRCELLGEWLGLLIWWSSCSTFTRLCDHVLNRTVLARCIVKACLQLMRVQVQ